MSVNKPPRQNADAVKDRQSFRQARERRGGSCLLRAGAALLALAGAFYAGSKFERAQVEQFCRSTAEKIGNLFKDLVEDRPDLKDGGGHARHAIDPEKVMKDNEQ